MAAHPEVISDESLASSISDDGHLSSNASQSEEDGMLEVGILGQGANEASSVDLSEEPFSVDDFDAPMSMENEASEFAEAPVQAKEELYGMEGSAPSSKVDARTLAGEDELPEGQVTEFRKTLSALSRQLEIDKLTFLYQKLHSQGSELPSLESIASDIRGDAPLQSAGDRDLYSKRPMARLQGWISGLSFGVGRRAKKFSR